MSMLKIKYICTLVKNYIKLLSKRSVDLSLEEKILICLKASKSESFQAVVEILSTFLRLLWAQFVMILHNAWSSWLLGSTHAQRKS